MDQAKEQEISKGLSEIVDGAGGGSKPDLSVITYCLGR
ncbi:hypothetical protein LCGC14_1496600 [marine sediment metagenome]|uniref:Uncharacterized protein n=1 Tax=marine sediment metagenome TaxID=412755 RepID=A0A0F9JR70_9ZZZZ